MKRIVITCQAMALLCTLIVLCSGAQAQSFINGDLNGTVGVSATATGWSQVPFGTPFSQASGVPQATSDVTNLTGPLAGAGINGNPYSGTTLVSGLKVSNYGSFWHEGLRQTVTGFTPGNSYTITFWQTVVKQSNVQDNSGVWDIYRDNTFVGSSSPTTSTQPYNSNNLPWEQKTVSFVATAGTHILSFMPGDDDANLVGMAGVRMGIDAISLSTAVVLPVTVSLSANMSANGVVLDWILTDDVHADRYFLERSVDGLRFDRIHEGVPGLPGAYQHQDAVPGAGTAFYRLGFRLMSGEVVWSEVETVHAREQMEVFVHQDVLHIRGDLGATHKVEVFALSGANVYTGSVAEQLEMNFLAPGIYLIKATREGDAHSVVTRRARIGL